MAKVQNSQPLVPSILDRLLDYEPDQSREALKSTQQVLRETKQSVQRDLDWLLNTRFRATSSPPDFEELDNSLTSYGIPDFAAAGLGNQSDREILRRMIEKVIRNHETRFKTVKVILAPNNDPADRRLRLRVEALLYAEPAPEPVVFDTHLELLEGTFTVTPAQ